MTGAQSFADRDGWIWMNGELVPWREAKVHVLTHTLHYGLGVFEGVRAYETHRGATIFRLDDHSQRLLESAHILGLKIPVHEAGAERRPMSGGEGQQPR